jgi:hypothetical protein
LEKELYKDKWVVKSQDRALEQEKQGLGVQSTIAEYGIAWFMPKIDWLAWNFLPDYAPRMVANNPSICKVFHRRKQAIRMTINSAILITEAQLWALKFDIVSDNGRKRLWLEYLWAINLQLFRECIGNAIKADLKLEYLQQGLAG